MPEEKELRIVSLLASATEMIDRFQLQNYLVARSHECDFPPEVLKLPSVTSPKFPVDGTSYDIDQRVRAIVAEGLSVYRVDAEKLFSLRPTHILTQTQCHVCAVSESDVKEAVEACAIEPNVKIVNFEAADFEGVLLDIRKLAQSLQADLAGENLIRQMKSRLQLLSEKTKALALNRPTKVFLIEWIDPLISAGHWMPELVEFAGGQIVLGKKGELSPVLKWDQVLAADPDLILIAPCGFGLEKTKEELAQSLATEVAPWKKLRAFHEKKIFISDGNQFFNRSGPRLVESAEIIAEAIFEDRLNTSYRKSGLLLRL